jgi:hypothetical protein
VLTSGTRHEWATRSSAPPAQPSARARVRAASEVPSLRRSVSGTVPTNAAQLQTASLSPARDYALISFEFVEPELQTGEALCKRRQAVTLNGALASLGRTQLRVDDPT